MPRKNASAKILEAAQQCLIEGNGDFEMTDVAKRASVSEGLAYHYFKSKAGLITAVVEDFYKRYTDVANHPYDREIPWGEREHKRLKILIEFMYSEPLAPIILGQMSQTPQAAAAETIGREEMIELAGHNIRSGIRSGQIDSEIDPAIAGAAIVGAVRHAFIHAMGQKKRPGAAKLTKQLWSLISGAVGLT